MFFMKTYPNTCHSEKCRNFKNYQKWPSEAVLQNACSRKFSKIYRKTSVFESLLNKIVVRKAATLSKKRLRHRCFKNTFLKTISARLFLKRFRNKAKKFFELSHKHRSGNIYCDR